MSLDKDTVRKVATLARIKVPDAELEDFRKHMRATSYEFREETANPIYRMFLAGD